MVKTESKFFVECEGPVGGTSKDFAYAIIKSDEPKTLYARLWDKLAAEKFCKLLNEDAAEW